MPITPGTRYLVNQCPHGYTDDVVVEAFTPGPGIRVLRWVEAGERITISEVVTNNWDEEARAFFLARYDIIGHCEPTRGLHAQRKPQADAR